MKITKLNFGWAVLGMASLGSLTHAEEKLVPVSTALSGTTISGYVDTSAVWAPAVGDVNPPPFSFDAGKQNGFNLDVVDLKIAKPLSEGAWSAGYTIELMFGPDAPAVTGAGATDTGIGQNVRQAFVALRAPVGNGLEFSLGRWDSLLGYESTDSYKNANWTRSYGYTLEPTEQTGLLMAYKFNDFINASVGVANTVTTGPINFKGPPPGNSKALVSLLTLTAPDKWALLGGDVLYVGVDYGAGTTNADRTHLYIGSTLKTACTNLTFGAAVDSINNTDVGGVNYGYALTVAGYSSYKITDKLSAHARFEYGKGAALGEGLVPLNRVIDLTGTLQYDLWQNVLSRLEVRWDHAADGQDAFGGTVPGVPTLKNAVQFAVNVVYTF